jgi:hypothetical protein
MVPPREKHRQRWKEAQDRRLRELVASGLPTRVVALRLGRTTLAVRTRAHQLGITLGVSPPAGASGESTPATPAALPPDRAA